MATQTATITNGSPSTLRATLRVARAGALAAATATAVVEAYAAVARGAGVPMLAGAPGAHEAQAITVGTFAMAVIVCAFWGTVIAAALTRIARRPAKTFVTVAVALTAISLLSPLAAAHTATTTKAILAGGHILAAAVAVPIIARHLPARRSA